MILHANKHVLSWMVQGITHQSFSRKHSTKSLVQRILKHVHWKGNTNEIKNRNENRKKTVFTEESVGKSDVLLLIFTLDWT